MSRQIPIIDLFAGPGGLGEGFSSLKWPDRIARFDIRLSIEKDAEAIKTPDVAGVLQGIHEAWREGA